MKQIFTIHLNQLRFHAFHGLYEAEKLLGNEFEVSVDVKYEAEPGIQTTINNTIDYVTLYQKVKEHMERPGDLLETVAQELAEEILKEFSIARYIRVRINKLTLPVAGIEGSAGVTYELHKNK
ncbi:MAG TPA: dihydroneopterin aldolase [Parasegetibacter sp.]|jgi:dihydroneopterin aldolase